MNRRRSRSVRATPEGIERIETERRKQKLTLNAIGESANVSSDTLKRLMKGDRIDRNSIRDIVAVLNLKPTDIVEPEEWNPEFQTEAKQPDASALITQGASTRTMMNPLQSSDLTVNSVAKPDLTFYVDRSPVETTCFTSIEIPGALLRIKAPQQMGKTALTNRILWQATQLGYQTAYLSFQLATDSVLEDLDTFLKWFCAVITRELGLSNQLEQYWEAIFASSFNTTIYFQDYLLAQIQAPLVLILDNTDRVFEHAKIADDFCRLLRSWYDQSNRGDRASQIWQKLRLVIVHATEIYSALDINASPLAGVGIVVDLPEFSEAQVQNLAQRHGLDWDAAEVKKITHLVGGHPYLVRLSLEKIQHKKMMLDQILETAPTETGIYNSHLRQLLSNLEQSQELVAAFKSVVATEDPVPLKPAQAFKLYSMGLVQLEGNQAKPRCLLYRQYFRNCLST
ncbi:MAG: AAA-like domain-containing protein [Oscillatoriophycideae cyanobacterium NC_groundwater_1537_Pr4_S-0.65um_50_18]|nr:AAA-like domain-containing protein [Oscillatoriophycideae cyanobacterium NC_groundwater_1537_Pr4_S-0.65um_50_18]